MRGLHTYCVRVLLIGVVLFFAVLSAATPSVAAEDGFSLISRQAISLGFNPFVVAIIESDTRQCYHDNPSKDLATCVREQYSKQGIEAPDGFFSSIRLAVARQRSLDGRWTTFDNFRGQTVRGNLVITGRTGAFTSSLGTATFAFYQTKTIDEWVFSYSTSYNDVGVGWLHMSDDACSMWGSFYSNSQSDGGRFLMARC